MAAGTSKAAGKAAKSRKGQARLLQGNEAASLGALAAGCNFFAGYPITPASEITEYMSREMPVLGNPFIQMEDEIASIGACVGASLAGRKAMTATSGPGFSLMQENLGYAMIVEAPMVVVNVMRGGPSTRAAHQRGPGRTCSRPVGAPTATIRPSCFAPARWPSALS